MNQNIQEKENKIVRVSLLGPCNVGKTTFIHFICRDQINQNELSTMGTNVLKYIFDKNKTIQFWDNPGQERYRNIMWQMNKRFKAFIFIFDLSDGESFTKIKQWLSQLQQKFPLENVIFYAFGNKSDLPRAIQKDFIQNFWAQKGIQYNEISFINNGNTKKIIDRVLSEIWYKIRYLELQEQKNLNKNIKLSQTNAGNNNKQVKRRCC